VISDSGVTNTPKKKNYRHLSTFFFKKELAKKKIKLARNLSKADFRLQGSFQKKEEKKRRENIYSLEICRRKTTQEESEH
jgi:hypothetical protein